MLHFHLKLSAVFTGLSLCLAPTLWAQEKPMEGIVMRLDNSQTLTAAKITNLSTAVEVQTDKDGKFQLPGKLYDKFAIQADGFQLDTVFIHELGVQRIYLLPDHSSILLDEVLVSRLSDGRLATEIQKAETQGKYADISKNRGGIRISPFNLFGKEGKLARQNIDLLRKERDTRIIDRRFTNRLISSLTPLDEEEILLFRQKYRPSLEFSKTATETEMQMYINDAYKKFKNK